MNPLEVHPPRILHRLSGKDFPGWLLYGRRDYLDGDRPTSAVVHIPEDADDAIVDARISSLHDCESKHGLSWFPVIKNEARPIKEKA